MHKVQPTVYLIAEPKINWNNIDSYLRDVGGVQWSYDRRDDLAKRNDPEEPDFEGVLTGTQGAPETLIEFMGKACYRSWAPGLNPNVKQVRSDQAQYIRNILSSKHGSVLEHVNFSFMFHGVSRVFTHELVRHRAGSAFSQESMRFVRLDDLPFWTPRWAQEDLELMENLSMMLETMETFQNWMADHFHLDEDEYDCPECEGVGAITKDNVTNLCDKCHGDKKLKVTFHEKKMKTSFMRRFAPDGVGTSIGWTANVRTLRHVIEQRTAEGAEEEIRLVFDKVASILTYKHPALFGDLEKNDAGEWKTEWSKV